MKIKNLEKFIRKIQKSFSKAGITTVIEKGLSPPLMTLMKFIRNLEI